MHGLSDHNYFARSLAETRPIARLWCSFARRFACAPRLRHYNHRARREISRGAHSDVNAITFTEIIHGRTYVIVTSPVGPDRWRAEVARTPGVTTSLMPFYGPTPDAAAGQLAGWLERAGNRSRRQPGV